MLGADEVEALLDTDALIDGLAAAMADASAGRASLPPRNGARVEERDGLLAAMPAFVPSAAALTAKLVTLFSGNAGGPLPTHQAVIVAFDPDTGAPMALLDGTTITARRTAAGSALSARLLARADARVLAILGTGVQARSHAEALTRVRSFERVRVAGREPVRASALADELSERLAMPVDAVAGYADAVDGADVVCATTHSAEPVVRGEWLAPGAHVTSVGFNPAGRELDDAALGRAAVVAVETRAAALAPFPAGANDAREPVEGGLLSAGDLVEIGELVAGTRRGREGDDDVTIYNSVGVAVQDAAAAALVLAEARRRGAPARTVEL